MTCDFSVKNANFFTLESVKKKSKSDEVLQLKKKIN